MMEDGMIYVLTNLYMPGLVKIGCTTVDVEGRIAALSSGTGVPVPFQCHFAARVSNMAAKEKRLHQLFGEWRVNEKREFFKVDPEKVVLAIQMGDFEEVTPGKIPVPPDEEQALEKALEKAEKRPPISMESIGIMPEAVLTFSRNEDVHATVLPGNKVSYDGQEMSLSGAAAAALNLQSSAGVRGPLYWMYNGKTLNEIRLEKEENSYPG
jgi:hypothetical protein